jgi:phosphoserine phosphatase RsbU/P
VKSALRGAKRVVVDEDRVLLSPGETNHALFFVLAGRVRVELTALAAGPTVTIGPGEHIGEFSVCDGKPVSARLVAEAGTRLLVVEDEDFWRDILPLPGVARNFFRAFAERFRLTNSLLLEASRKQLELAKMRRELELAREIQASMVPAGRPLFPGRAEVEAFARLEPAHHIGGDFLDAFLLREDRLFLTVGDVAGKGVPAALFMAKSLALLHREARKDRPLHEMLHRVNELLCEGNAPNLFLTVFCAVLDLSSGALAYVNGGHPNPLVVGGDGAVRALPSTRGMIVGAFETARFAEGRGELRPGELLLAYTDGMTEALNVSGDMFGETRLAHALAEERNLSTADLATNLLERILTFSGTDLPQDDLSLLALRYHGPQAH